MNPELLLLIIRVLAALILYAFFALAIIAVWRSASRWSVAEQVIPQVYAAHLQGDNLIQNHRLGAINFIGRAADNTIVLGDESVSAHHAKLAYTGGQWLLEDLGSRNGTFVNELRLEGPLVVTLKDQILIGGVMLQLEAQVPLDEVTFTL
jgi:hypothetical protein